MKYFHIIGSITLMFITPIIIWLIVSSEFCNKYEDKYTEAINLYESEKLDEAYDLFSEVDPFLDSDEYKIKIINTWKAYYFLQNKEYGKAKILKKKYDLIHVHIPKNNYE